MARLQDLRGASPLALDSNREVRGRIAASPNGLWRLELEISEQRGELAHVQRRTLEATHCDELGDAAALAISIALDAGPVSAPSEGAGSGVRALGALRAQALAAGDLQRDTASSEPAAVRRQVPARHDFAVAIGAAAALDLASLAGPAIGGSIDAELRIDAMGIGAYGLWLPVQREAVRGASSGQYVEFSLLGAGVRGCYRLLDRTVQVDGCTGFEAGKVVAVAHGLNATRDARDPWFAPQVGAALTWNVLANLAVRTRLDALFPLGRDQYVVDLEETVHRTPRATARLFMGVQGRFGPF